METLFLYPPGQFLTPETEAETRGWDPVEGYERIHREVGRVTQQNDHGDLT